jgi:hypothetical protein
MEMYFWDVDGLFVDGGLENREGGWTLRACGFKM